MGFSDRRLAWLALESANLRPGTERMQARGSGLIHDTLVAMTGGVTMAAGARSAPQAASRDVVPTFDVKPSCESAAARSTVPVGTTENTADICIRKELDAREQMVRDWSSFSTADRSYCVPLASQGGTPTYTELLTCLELAREARNLKTRDPMQGSTTGSAGASDRNMR